MWRSGLNFFWFWTSDDSAPPVVAEGDEIIYYVINHWHRTRQ